MIKETTSEAAGASGCSRVGWVSASAVASPPATAADLFQEIWAEVADWQCQQALLERARILEAAQPAPPPEPAVEPVRPMRALSTKAILALDDEAFVMAAYYSLLGRLPDPSGLADMRAQLARGCSKADMLRGMHGSLEAQQRRARARKDLLTRPLAVLRQITRGGVLDEASAGPLAPDEWRARVERRLSEQQAALERVTSRFAMLQAAQDELAETTRSALLAQDRRLGDQAVRGAGLVKQIMRREDELVAATASLSDEIGALSHRLASMVQDGEAPRGVSRGPGKAARR